MAPKRRRTLSTSQHDSEASASTSTTEGPSHSHTGQRAKKLKLLASHALSSPFPDWPHPTPAEAQRVHTLLASAHPAIAASCARRMQRPDGDGDGDGGNSAQTCGRVANVLDALIGTILSQNTSARNSTAAKRGLDAAFGRHNFRAVAEAPPAAVVDAIRTGGLANKKAAVIQKILREVFERHGAYSLQHLARGVPQGAEKGPAHAVTDDEAMQELVSYDGVGPKTASCVLLFSLGRFSFPVDTHVFRLSRLLGWVPDRADRVTAQAHLDLRVPDHLKYGLHVLMVGHGRSCSGCKSSGGASSKGKCVLKEWRRVE